MISLTGKFAFSILLALSQYVVPYTEEQKAAITEAYKAEGFELEEWQVKALNFEPLNIYELLAISGDERALAQYIRTACIRIHTSTQPQEPIDEVIIEAPDITTLRAFISPSQLEELQTRVRDSEQEIDLAGSMDYFERACDLRHPVEAIEKIALFDNPQSPFELTYENAKDFVTIPLSFGSQFGESEEDPFITGSYSFPAIDIPPFYEGALREVLSYYGEIYFALPQVDSKDDLPYLPEQSLVFDSNGQLIGDYSATEVNTEYDRTVRSNRRVLVRNSEDIPDKLKKALISVEDSDFYNHLGVDLSGAMRAVQSSGSGDVQGASTLTMQLVKNLILYEDVFLEQVEGSRSIVRKLQEYILVRQIESVLTKDEILEMYLNTIDFGRKVQGIVLASKVYFGKELTELRPDENASDLSAVAFLAGLPKAPNGLEPTRDYDRALRRRNKVLRDMFSNKYITEEEFVEAMGLDLEVLPISDQNNTLGYATHYVNAVQKQVRDWGILHQRPNLYKGFELTAPINHEYQKWAVETLQRGLLKYERSQSGSRGLTVKPHEDQLPNIAEQVRELADAQEKPMTEVFKEILEPIENRYPDASQFELGVVINDTELGLKDGTKVPREIEDQPANLKKVVDGRNVNLQPWDVVMLQPFPQSNGTTKYKIASFTKVRGGVVVIDNATGAVLATAGRFSVGAGGRYKGSGGNDAFSEINQPGSTVKPFVYLHAMNKGILPTQTISNGSIRFPAIDRVESDQCNNDYVRSVRNERPSYTLHDGLVNSKNVFTLNTFARASGVPSGQSGEAYSRELESGLDELSQTFQAFGLYRQRKSFCYPVLLGAHDTRVFEIAGAYSTLSRDGEFIQPFTVSSMVKIDGTSEKPTVMPFSIEPQGATNTPNVQTSSANIFRLKQMLYDVVQRGTARSIKDSPWSGNVGGKTGTVETCNKRTGACKNIDGWFIGFNEEVTVAVWVGYQRNENLGEGVHGSDIALPIFKDFMDQYYTANPDKLPDGSSLPTINQSVPDDLISVNIEGTTGFIIDDNFRNDFAAYTGLNASNLDRFTTTIYVTEDERRNLPQYSRTNAAMSFFYSQLSGQKKSELRQNYLSLPGNQVDSSAFDRWMSNHAVCEPWFYINDNGQTTWDQSFRRYSDRPNRATRERINNACFYIVNNARPPEPQQVSATDAELRRYFIENY